MEYKVENLIDSVSKKHTFPGDKIIFLNTSDIEKGYVLHNNYSMIDSLPGQAKKSIQKGDILYSEIRPKNERFAYINFASDDYVVSTKLMVLRNKKPEILNTKYFYLYITSKNTIDYLQNLAESRSGTFPQITFSEVKNMVIDIPTLAVQNKIVNSIESIDKKIELNKIIIANLEELSQTLFKRWFVDFEFPDENGNPYKSSGGEMVDSELGEIPERWEVVKLKDIVYQKKDTFNPKKSNELKVLHFSLPAFDSSQNPVIDDVNAIKSNKWIIDENCILFSKMNPSTRRIWLTSNDGKYLNVASSEFVVLKSDNSYKNAFIYNICTSDKFSEFLNSNTTGSTNSRQRVKPDIAISYKLAFHNETSMLFSNKVEPYLEKIKVIRNENQKLAELRDTLLPKLMSGEIEISDDIEVNEDELSI
ncbi:restriction endonuclease subunit S [Staphylococcus xylosus]|uniref:restriction endonuclease subunit S n=1 Tax=Staphylococcus xylosus TaxID=1288 RepID=UPI003F55BF73